MLFQSFGQLKAIMGLAISNDVELVDIQPYIEEAENTYLLPLLGQTLLTKLSDQTSLTTKEQKALKYAQTFAGCMAVYQSYDLNGVTFSSGGNTRYEGNEIKTPFKYQDESFKRNTIARGYNALDDLHFFLGTNLADFTDLSATEKKRLCGSFINTTKDMQRVITRSISRETFDEIRPLVKEVERFLLCSTIGEEAYNILLAELLDGLIAEPDELLSEMQHAIGQFAFREAIARNLITITNGIVVRKELTGDDAAAQLLTPTDGQLTATAKHFTEYANRHVARYRAIMLLNPDDYPEFITWNDAQVAAQEEAMKLVTYENTTTEDQIFPEYTTKASSVSGRIF